MRLARAAAIGLLTGLLMSACVPTVTTRSPAEAAAAKDAQSLADQGQYDQAARAYLALADANSGQADHYRLRAAEAYRESGQLSGHADLVEQIARRGLSDAEASRLSLLQAELALDRNDPHTALRLMTDPALSVPNNLQLRLLELRARAMAGSGDPWGAARTRVEMDSQLSGLDQTQNRRQILTLLGQLGVPALRQRATAMQNGDRMLPWINEALVQQGVAVASSQPRLGQPVGTLVPGQGASVREGFEMPRQVALLLPTSGDYAGATNAIREGFFAAYAEAARSGAPRASVRIYDTAGTPSGAVAAYQHAVSDGVQLVVGPLTRGAVSAVFGQASLAVPVLALNHADNKRLPGSNAMEFGLLPEAEGAQVADHMIERGQRSVYVVTSTDDFAQRALGAFKAELLARGGQVIGGAQIRPGQVNYTAALGGLNINNMAPDAGIFISMRPEQARLLLPQLRVASIQLPVYGTSHIYGGMDDAGNNRDLDGVEFCDAPWLFNAQPGLPSHDDIANQLPVARGSSARLFAFGMDAWNLLPYLTWLRTHAGSYLPGATGQLAADSFGRVRRVLVWAKFNGGIAQPLNGNLQMDDVPSSAPPLEPSESRLPAPAAPPSVDSGKNASVLR